MPVNTKAQIKATTKYVSENYDRILIKMPKGRREIIKARAAGLGLNTNAYINKLLCEDCGIDMSKKETETGA